MVWKKLSLGHWICAGSVVIGFCVLLFSVLLGGPDLPWTWRYVFIWLLAAAGIGSIVGLYVDVFQVLSAPDSRSPRPER